MGAAAGKGAPPSLSPSPQGTALLAPRALTQVVPPQQARLLEPQATLPHVPQQVVAVPAGHGPRERGAAKGQGKAGRSGDAGRSELSP